MPDHLCFENVKTMLFDFEGTLVDFQWKLSEAIDETLELLRSMGVPKERIASRKYSTLMTEAMQVAPEIGLSPAEVRQRIGSVYDRYDEDALTRWSVRPGAKDFISTLRENGVRTALVSNIGGKTLPQALERLHLSDCFDVALNRDHVQNLKPSPDLLNLALEKLGGSREHCLMIGDSLDDLNAARNAGIRIVIITDGENARDAIVAAKPDYLISGYEQLLASPLFRS